MQARFPPSVRLQGQRVSLVPLTVGDAADMLPVLASPSLYLHTGGAPPTLPELTARYARQLRGPGRGDEAWLTWVVRDEDRAVGFVQATVRSSGPGLTADVAWLLGAAEQGRGRATEAAGVLVGHLLAHGCSPVRALIADANTASAAVARRLGMRRSALVVDGEHAWLLAGPDGAGDPVPDLHDPPG